MFCFVHFLCLAVLFCLFPFSNFSFSSDAMQYQGACSSACCGLSRFFIDQWPIGFAVVVVVVFNVVVVVVVVVDVV